MQVKQKRVHGLCLKSVPRTIHYARFHTQSHRCCREMRFISRLDTKISTKSVEHENVGHWHLVMVCAQRVCQARLLYNLSYSQLSLLQRNALYFQAQHKILTKSVEHEMQVKGTRSQCVVVKCIKGRILGNISYSQLSLLQRNALYFQAQHKILTKSVEHEMQVKGTRVIVCGLLSV